MSDDISNQRLNLPLVISTETCSGGTYIVTGANTGLGFEAANHLVGAGAAKVILAVRNGASGDAAKNKIVQDTGNSSTAQVWILDLASYESVKAFAKRVHEELDRVDAVIENAAVATGEGKAEGHGLTMTVNVYSTFLLAMLLLPKLVDSANRHGITPHLTVVSSGASFDAGDKWKEIKNDPLVKMDDDDIGLTSYPLSKLIEIFFVRELADKLPVSQHGVVINLVNPGLCRTELSRNAPPDFKKRIHELKSKYGRTAEDGSRTLLHGAVAGRESHGIYLSDCELSNHKLPTWITDKSGNETQKLVWESLAKELELISPGCVKNLI